MKFIMKSTYQYIFVLFFKFVLVAAVILIGLIKYKKTKLAIKFSLYLSLVVFITLMLMPVYFSEALSYDFNESLWGIIYLHTVSTIIGFYLILKQKKWENTDPDLIR